MNEIQKLRADHAQRLLPFTTAKWLLEAVYGFSIDAHGRAFVEDETCDEVLAIMMARG